MGEFNDSAHMIQRVIDNQYPNTRLMWQSLQPGSQDERDIATALPTIALRPVNKQPETETLDKTVERVIDHRYPEARIVWLRTRDPKYAKTSAARTRSLSSGGSILPSLNGTTDPRWAKFSANRSRNLTK
jgi:hypothetical protein